ncbi:hypothetical protein Taro_035120 [Colocasia esculenta]|uniref:Uncharacterized protein n=1 Tax=Colocasia esculenta TaxID=4460 RepID=A0A843W4U7_COLES|nr:hypothetical protein [Colocasia esculenta]
MGRRRPGPSRQGRNGTVRRDHNRCAVFKMVGRTELSQALLDRERSCRGFFERFGIPAWRRTLLSRPGRNRPTRRNRVSYRDMSWCRDQKAALTSFAATAEGSISHAFGDLVIQISVFDVYGFVGPYVRDCETESCSRCWLWFYLSRCAMVLAQLTLWLWYLEKVARPVGVEGILLVWLAEVS